MMFARFIGWVLFLAGLAVLVRDLLVLADTGHWAPLTIGRVWHDIDRASLNLAAATTQRYLSPFLWDPIITALLSFWSFLGLTVIGAVILILCHPRRRRRF